MRSAIRRRPNERGVFRAIRKVFASFYNDNAFLERLKHDVNEAQVGMALLVHHSFPDEIELANGVATLEKSRGPDWSASVVEQKGAVSVTNPPTDAVPEEVRIEAGFEGPSPQVVRRSSLVSLRENTVLAWDAEYLELYELLVAAAERYCQETQKDDIVLDFEFKKIAPDGRLVIKQIREIPRPGDARVRHAVPAGAAETYWTLQGRGSNVFTNHRLKSRWTLQPKNLWLSEENLQSCVYDEVTIEYVADGQIQHEIARIAVAARRLAHLRAVLSRNSICTLWWIGWQFPDLGNPRTYRLRTTPLYQADVPDPVVTLGDFRTGGQYECLT